MVRQDVAMVLLAVAAVPWQVAFDASENSVALPSSAAGAEQSGTKDTHTTGVPPS